MRILVVDDSIVFRTAIKTALLNSEYVTEVDVVSNGRIAIQKLEQKEYDGITLDLEMPIMDGQESIIEIRKINKKIPIIVFSAVSMQAATKTFKALELGADDFVQKLQESNDVHENLQMIQNEVVPKLKALISRRARQSGDVEVLKTISGAKKPVKNQLEMSKFFKADLICIGSSTGGPDTLKQIFKKLDHIEVPMLIIQHMPPIFTTQLAKGLNDLSKIEVKEAKHGDKLKPGVCYIAPGDFHMRLIKDGDEYTLELNQEEKVCFVRPAVDVTLMSVSDVYQGKVASFILTGMGNDGANGNIAIKEKIQKNLVVIQDEVTSVVWGMPKAVFESSAYDEIQSPDEIVKTINTIGKR